MAIDIILPELGENIEQGEVVSILVAVGDTVAEDQALMEVETGKATVEVPATSAGVVETLHVSVGDQVALGAVLVSLSGLVSQRMYSTMDVGIIFRIVFG